MRLSRWERSSPVPLDLGVRIAPSGGAFELRATRADYSSPVDVVQVDATDPDVVLRDLPDTTVRDWFVLPAFLHLSLRNAAGKVVRRLRFDVCPNRAQMRIGTGPDSPVYPPTCTANPLSPR